MLRPSSQAPSDVAQSRAPRLLRLRGHRLVSSSVLGRAGALHARLFARCGNWKRITRRVGRAGLRAHYEVQNDTSAPAEKYKFSPIFFSLASFASETLREKNFGLTATIRASAINRYFYFGRESALKSKS